jgi:hypothetical protein
MFSYITQKGGKFDVIARQEEQAFDWDYKTKKKLFAPASRHGDSIYSLMSAGL